MLSKLTKKYTRLGTDYLYQVKATRDIPEIGVKENDLGGYVYAEGFDENSWLGPKCSVLSGKLINSILIGDIFSKESIIKDSYIQGSLSISNTDFKAVKIIGKGTFRYSELCSVEIEYDAFFIWEGFIKSNSDFEIIPSLYKNHPNIFKYRTENNTWTYDIRDILPCDFKRLKKIIQSNYEDPEDKYKVFIMLEEMNM